jgi:protein SCO1
MSQDHSKSPTWKVLGILFLLLVVPILWVMFNKTGVHYSRKLPIYFERELADNGDTIYHTISNFKLMNQNGDSVTLDTYKDKILLVNFFFASCETVCPVMSTYISDHIFNEFKKDTNIRFLSFTVDPKNDSASVLKAYARKYAANENWDFLTGSKSVIYDLAENSFRIPGAEGAHQDLFHSDKIVLIDKQKRVRGVFDTNGEIEKRQTIDAVRALKFEYKENENNNKK